MLIRLLDARHRANFVSDSRLSYGADWHCCPKLMLLPRDDSLIGFAGSTFDPFPLMQQFRNWIETDPEREAALAT